MLQAFWLHLLFVIDVSMLTSPTRPMLPSHNKDRRWMNLRVSSHADYSYTISNSLFYTLPQGAKLALGVMRGPCAYYVSTYDSRY